jgi:ribosomal peptide maturation radical SAM protein 1
MKVLLISMPYGALERQALGISLLKAQLTREGIPCNIRYLNFAFSEFIGADEYRWVNYSLPYTAFAGDWSFVKALYGEQPGARNLYVREILQNCWQLASDDVARLLRISGLTEPFLAYCMAALPWQEYGLVGFTSTFEQNIASLALAKRLKQAYPRVAIAFGGANWEANMGLELHHRFSFVDYVCSGEAESSFPALVRAIQKPASSHPNLRKIPGLVFREQGKSVSTGPSEGVKDMDGLPFPDYSDYFRDLEQCTAGTSVVPTMLFESSRGCWWGAKSHCTFCGLNGGSMAFRSKSSGRVIEELRYLTQCWRLEFVEAVDNILDMKYFQDLLPSLARARLGVQIFYEVKANLSRRQVELLRASGINRIQPGIESLSDRVLKLMRKGSTSLGNIQLLKWCREYQISVDWNLLYGFPGETKQDYDQMLELLRAIRFLAPPTACGPVRMDRFSPYYESPLQFGMTHVRPMIAYKHLYPFSDESLRQIAYYFDYDYAPEVDPRGAPEKVIRFVEQWQQEPERGCLTAVERGDDSLVLVDTRSDRLLTGLVLKDVEKAAYQYCDEAHSANNVARHLRNLFPQAPPADEPVVAFLDSLVANRLMVTDGMRYLSLGVYADRPTNVAVAAQRPSLKGTGSGAEKTLVVL